ncbi:hypothetical protein Dda_7076 [Drechslerella dactyloides]|uniref:Uncharacterized protein n=1 Tax=Drechslerella dactyloides TaxID=74499 RepID=A0AAD6NH76_DREDA|nr:hypothetical protein Dda_7076 [Drechslerella dactyloides]
MPYTLPEDKMINRLEIARNHFPENHFSYARHSGNETDIDSNVAFRTREEKILWLMMVQHLSEDLGYMCIILVRTTKLMRKGGTVGETRLAVPVVQETPALYWEKKQVDVKQIFQSRSHALAVPQSCEAQRLQLHQCHVSTRNTPDDLKADT